MRGVASLVQGFPGVPAVAVVSEPDGGSGERLLELGACGVRHVVDLRRRDGWQRLRELVNDPATPAGAEILRRLLPALGPATPECRQFFEALVRLAPYTPSVRRLARQLEVRGSTFMSRFFRAQVPSPKRYLAAVRVVYAAWYLEEPGRSVADAAYVLQYSSPQSFGRHLRTVLGVTAVEFRRRFSFHTALEDFLVRLVLPNRSRFRTFRPFANGVRDLGHQFP
jgi:AraC-like DNA-binding protein